MPTSTSVKEYVIPPKITNLRNSLRTKLTLVIVLVGVIPSVLNGAAILLRLYGKSPQSIYWLTLFLSIVSITLGIILVKKLIKPINTLYQGAQILAKGELEHRFNIHSGDEIEFISQFLNLAAQNLKKTIGQISYDKDLAAAEKNKLNTIISSLTDGIIVLDLHQKVVLANRSAEKITGFQNSEMIDQTIASLITLKDQDNKEIPAKEYCKISPGGEENILPSQIQANLFGKNGSKTEVTITTTQITQGIQTDLGCILIMHDITQEKIFEQMQIDFVSMASHEIRTPLTSVINYLSVLKEESGDKLKSDQKEFLDRAFDTAKELSSLVENLLNVSKIERASFSVSLKPLDWLKRVTKIVENNQTQAVDKNITLRLNLPSQPIPQVLADNVRIDEVLNNLISNAINYTKEGGKIEVGVKLEGKEIITSVSDNGPGIPKEALSHLFVKFFRVPGALEEGNKGSGLGLYISKSIIDLHHGRIWVESEVGKGSTFYFSLLAIEGPQPTIATLHNS